VARLGRAGGALAYVTLAIAELPFALSLCFGQEKSSRELTKIAHETPQDWGKLRLRRQNRGHDFRGVTASRGLSRRLRSFAAGASNDRCCHRTFGNFELYARFGQFAPVYRAATTYRGLRRLRWIACFKIAPTLRLPVFERRFDGAALRSFMTSRVILGLLRPTRRRCRSADPFPRRELLDLRRAGDLCLATMRPLYWHCLRVGLSRGVGAALRFRRARMPAPDHQAIMSESPRREAAGSP